MWEEISLQWLPLKGNKNSIAHTCNCFQRWLLRFEQWAIKILSHGIVDQCTVSLLKILTRIKKLIEFIMEKIEKNTDIRFLVFIP